MTGPFSAGSSGPVPAASQLLTVRDVDLLRSLRLTVYDRLASYLTHELNQPISIARLTAENVLFDLDHGGIEKDVLRERVTTFRDQTERMTRVIQRLTHFGQRNESDTSCFDIRPVMDDVAATLRHAAAMSGLTYETSLPEEATVIQGNPRHLWLVLVGLLTMTWDPGRARQGGTANLRGSGILNHAERRKSTVALDLIHDGCEITGQPGSLAVQLASDVRIDAARHIVERMEGQFEVKIRDTGLHVRIVLPLAETASINAISTTRSPYRPNSMRSLCLLLVDDEELALEGIQEYLSRQGHQVITARNGKEALLQFAALPIDVVVTDLRMPVMDGNMLIRELRRQSTLPIIAMTGHAGPQDEEVALSDGASVVLRKPIRLRDLASTLEKATAVP